MKYREPCGRRVRLSPLPLDIAMRSSKRQAARKENNAIKLPMDIVDDVLQYLPARDMACAEATSTGMRAMQLFWPLGSTPAWPDMLLEQR